MTFLHFYIIALLITYILAFAYIFVVAWLNGGLDESIKTGLMYSATGAVFGLMAERLYKRLRKSRKR